MPILLDGARSAGSSRAAGGGTAAAEAGVVEIGLVNNMPDGALQATERQFVTLLAAACGERTVRLHFYAMPGVERAESAAAHIAATYADYARMGETRLDGLIVTGCEPRAASLAHEPFWESFTHLVDWAESNTTSTLWSCLAAHAAVLHLDGIARLRLPTKRSGVFEGVPVGRHPLLAGVAVPMRVAHSRWNDLREADLAEHGYAVLTRSAEAGVDLFVKDWNSLFVFFQGHPEYDPEALAREYRRDVARYLRGDRGDYPSMPQNYFDGATQTALQATRVLALADRASVVLGDLPRGLGPRPDLSAGWHDTSLPVYRNWIAILAQRGRS